MSKNLLEKRGLWDNIWAKRRRGAKMRKPGSKGAPTAEALKKSQVKEDHQPRLNAKTPTPKEIAHKFKKPIEEIMKAIATGQRVEKEHTTDPKVAREIATDHVNERPDYYTILKAVEKKKKLKEGFNDRRDIIDSLNRTGFQQKSGTRGGDHEVWTHPKTGARVAVPRHKVLSTGVARDIIKTVKKHEIEEAFETSEKQSKNPNDPSSRFDGTTSGTNVFKKRTPGQRARQLKHIVRSK